MLVRATSGLRVDAEPIPQMANHLVNQNLSKLFIS